VSKWQWFTAIKAGIMLAMFSGAAYAATAAQHTTVATIPVQRIMVNTPTDWSQVAVDATPAIIALLIALTAYVKSRTVQQAAVTANNRAIEVATKVDAVTSQVNGSLTQTQERVARLEGLMAQPIHARDPISPIIDPLPHTV
jgi:hypothetical protein